MHFTKWITLSITLLPGLSFAFFCPTNFKQINFGDTMEQVQKQCGAPDKKVTKDKKKEAPQEWSFFIPQTVAAGTTAQTQGTLKTQIVFDSKGNAINISVNGIGVGASTICGKNIQLGDSREAIKAACGEPTFINKQTPETDEKSSDKLATPKKDVTKITEFTYNSNPPITLVFVNGILKERK